MFRRALYSFFLPGGLLFLAAVILLQTGVLDQALPDVVGIYPYVVFVATVLLGASFNRSRVVFVILVLALSDRSLLYFAAGSAASTGGGRVLYSAISLLVPLNLIAFFLLKEKGIWTRFGLRRLGLILLQGLGVALLYQYHGSGAGAFLERSFFKWSLLDLLHMSQPSLFIFVLAFLFFLTRYIQNRGPIERAFSWIVVSSFAALVGTSIGPVCTFYFSTAGLILVISAVESFYILGFSDELTGLPSRRALNEMLRTLGTGYVVAMVDIDSFKKINDRYGHDVGDQVLRTVATKLENVAGGGKAFRYGGEEFTIVFPGKFMHETIPHLQALKKVIKNSEFILRSPKRPRTKPDKPVEEKRTWKKVLVTVSMGVSERSDRGISPQQVVKAADEALFYAKKAGRNRISTKVASEEN